MIHFRKITAGPPAGVLPKSLSAGADFALENAVRGWLIDCNIVGNIVRGREYRFEKLVVALALEGAPDQTARTRLAEAIGKPTFLHDMSHEHSKVLTEDLDWLFSRFKRIPFEKVLSLMVAGEYEQARTFYRGLNLPLVYPVAAGDQPVVVAQPVPVLPPQPLPPPVVPAVSVALASPMDVDGAKPPLRQKRKADDGPPVGGDLDAAEILRTFTDLHDAGLSTLSPPPPEQPFMHIPESPLSVAPAQPLPWPPASAMSFSAATSLLPPPAVPLSQPIFRLPPAVPVALPTTAAGLWCETVRILNQMLDPERLLFLGAAQGNLQARLLEVPRLAPQINFFLGQVRDLLVSESYRTAYLPAFVAEANAVARSSRGPAS